MNRKFYGLPVFAGCMGILHGVHGAYPRLPLFRWLGLWTPEEIHRDHLTLKFLRGDFNGLDGITGQSEPPDVKQVLAMSER